MRGNVRGIGSVKVAGASCCSSRLSRIPFYELWIRANARRNDGAAAGEIGGNGDGAVRAEMTYGIVDKRTAIRSAERVERFGHLCHIQDALCPQWSGCRSPRVAAIVPGARLRRSRALHRGKV